MTIRPFHPPKRKPRVTFEGRTYTLRSSAPLPDFTGWTRAAVLTWLLAHVYARGIPTLFAALDEELRTSDPEAHFSETGNV